MFNFTPLAACVCNRTCAGESIYTETEREMYLDCQLVSYSRLEFEYNSPKSKGCVNSVAKQLALPPNQNGYRIGVFKIGLTSSLFRASTALTFLVRAAMLIVESANAACS